MALGLPVLIGGAGLGVDMAQWYMWKRELQNAVDQGAIAGAWAKGQDENGTTYLQRAGQEYSLNLSITQDFASSPVVSLEDYDGGTDNSVQVAASVSRALPFSSIFMDGTTTISVTARAIYEPAASFNPCLRTLDPSASKSMWFHGGPNVNSGCGLGAMSNASNAVSFEGSQGQYDIGYVITAGQVDDIQGHTANSRVIEGANTLADPYQGLTPPDNPTPRTYQCGASQWTADETVVVETRYEYFIGRNRNSLTPYPSYPTPKQGGTDTTVNGATDFANFPSNTTDTIANLVEVIGNGNDKVWEQRTQTTTRIYSNIVQSQAAGRQMPGTYTNMTLSCDTTLAPGVYVIDGGMLTVEGQHDLSGNGVMFVLRNGAGIRIAGGSSVNLSGMTYNQLTGLGIAAADAERMVGMVVFEDPESGGNENNSITGNSSSSISGIVYLPSSHLELLGTQRGVSQCMVVASNTMEIGGTADLTNLCPSGATPQHAMTTQQHSVRLVQ